MGCCSDLFPIPSLRAWCSAAEAISALSAADFLDLQRDNHTLSVLAGYRDDALTLAAADGEPVRVQGTRVTVDYFDVFATEAVIGRTFVRADAVTAEPLVMLGHDAWLHQFAGDPQIAGRRIRIDGVPHTVVGVMPASFNYPEGSKA